MRAAELALVHQHDVANALQHHFLVPDWNARQLLSCGVGDVRTVVRLLAAHRPRHQQLFPSPTQSHLKLQLNIKHGCVIVNAYSHGLLAVDRNEQVDLRYNMQAAQLRPNTASPLARLELLCASALTAYSMLCFLFTFTLEGLATGGRDVADAITKTLLQCRVRPKLGCCRGWLDDGCTHECFHLI
jgi:hypothetical protein